MNSTLPGMEKPLIKVAVPNKGSLSEPAAEMLREAGYAQRSEWGAGAPRRSQRRRVLLSAPARYCGLCR